MTAGEEEERPEENWLVSLSRWSELFKKGGEWRKVAMLHAVRTAMSHLRDEGATDHHLVPLSALLHALDRLNSGKSVAALAPRKGSPIYPDVFEGAFSVKRAHALVVEEIIYRALGGKRGVRRQAQAEAAELLTKCGFTTHLGRPLSKNVIRQWRTDLSDPGKEFDLLRSSYLHYIAMVPDNVSHDQGMTIAEEFARAVAEHPSFHLS
jgi:hypothetical protein